MRSLSFIVLFMVITTNHLAQSPHGDELKEDCSYCHESVSWNVEPGQTIFDHKTTGFKLNGQHRDIKCILCHQPTYSSNRDEIVSLAFSKVKGECFSCHKDIHLNTVGQNCERCHTSDSWIVKDISGVHQISRFPLTGAHKLADCTDCHRSFNNLVFEPLQIDCYSCHTEDYRNTTKPNHISAGFPRDCEDCHSISGLQWAAGNFKHDFFPLTGGHKIDNCFSCHNNNSFSGLSADCISCHRDDYDAVKDPDHVAGKFPLDCLQCHNINSFIPADFNHSLTNFPLTGAHISTGCISCHSTQYTGTSIVCASCHQQDYNQSINPSHTSIQLPTDCQSCHTTNPDWQPASFGIHNQYYELQGAHATIQNDCVTCHNGNYTTTPDNCYGCHKPDYDATVNPSHSAAQFPTQCENCHSQVAWQPAIFDHDGQYFPIYSGKHREQWANCSDCHTTQNNFAVFSCTNCHEHNKTETDNEHTGISGYVYESNSCYACHPKGDKEGAIDHSLIGFPLTGSHTTVDCIQCHKNGYSNTAKECVSCHQQNYNSSVNPSHTTLQLSTDCQSCHTTSPDWQPASFAIHNQFYQMTGAHAAIQGECVSCHNGNYTTTKNTCYGCHEQNYNTSVNPAHTAIQLPTDCQSCHTTNPDWQPATFAIHNQYYQLLGAHSVIQNNCVTCHNGNYTSTPNTCIGCHQQDYNTTTDPSHQAAGFPTQCEDCHSQSAWDPSTFNHDGQYFPIYSGNHKEAWTKCSDCHTNQGNFSIFSCIDCHEHNKTEMDDEHREVTNYIYNSTNCLSCHPAGREGKAIKINQR